MQPSLLAVLALYRTCRADKRHITINVFVRLALGRPRVCRGLLKGGLGEGCFQMAVALQFVLASATAMLVPFLGSLANPPTRSAKATICVFAKRVVHSGAISSLFCKMSPTRCGQFDMSFGSENTRSKSPPFSKPRVCPRDKSRWSLGQTEVLSLVYTLEA